MNDLFNLLMVGINDKDDYDNRKIGRVDPSNNKIGISTAYTTDMGYETALLDSNGVHPVERYINKEEALKGHVKWCLFAKSGKDKKIIKLGYGELIEDREIILKA